MSGYRGEAHRPARVLPLVVLPPQFLMISAVGSSVSTSWARRESMALRHKKKSICVCCKASFLLGKCCDSTRWRFRIEPLTQRRPELGLQWAQHDWLSAQD